MANKNALQPPHANINRRDFVRVGGLSLLSLIAAACGATAPPDPTVEATQALASMTPEQLATLRATLTPEQIAALTGTPVPPTPGATDTPAPTNTPSATNTPDATATPEALKPAETLREAGDRIGEQIGFTFYSDDAGSYRDPYKQRATKHFGCLWCQNEMNADFIAQYGDEGIQWVKKIARDGKQDMLVNGFFYSKKLPAELQGLSQDDPDLRKKVEANMRGRLQYVLPRLRGLSKPVYFIGNHEAIDMYQGKRIWEPDIYHAALKGEVQMQGGEEVSNQMFGVTAEIILDEAIKAGFTPGQDFFPMIGITDILRPGPLLDWSMDLYDNARKYLAGKMGIPYEQVPLGIVAEGHAVQSGTLRGHMPVPSLDEMVSALGTITQARKGGPVYLSEVELQEANAEQVGTFLSNVVTAGHRAGIKGVTLWPGLRDCNAQPEAGWCNPNGALFDAGGMPTSVYNKLLTTLNTLGGVPVKG